jgi:hypothetical protein
MIFFNNINKKVYAFIYIYIYIYIYLTYTLFLKVD